MAAKFYKTTKSQVEYDSEELEKYWDLKADEFYSHKNDSSSKEGRTKVIRLLLEKGFLNNDYKVLDIGCGTGNLAIDMAHFSKKIVGLDISGKMISYARSKAIEEGIGNVAFEKVSWRDAFAEVDGEQELFDLVLASITPAVNNIADIEKMIRFSRRYCCLGAFAYRKSDIKSQLAELAGVDDPSEEQSFFYTAFNILYHKGYYPEVNFMSNSYKIESTTDSYSRNVRYFVNKYNMGERQVRKMIKYLKSIEKEGIITESIQAKIGWLFWKIC